MLPFDGSQIDLSAPLDLENPDNAGLVFAYLGVDGYDGSAQWENVVSRSTTAVTGTWLDRGVRLNGTNQFFTLPSVLTVPFTIEFELRRLGTTGGDVVWWMGVSGSTQWNAHYIAVDNPTASVAVASVVNNNFTANTSSAAGAVPLGTWTHVAAVFASATSRTLYVNGRQVGQNTTSASPSGININAIGSNRLSTPDGWYDGAIRNIRGYSRALTADEILRSYEGIQDGANDPRLRRLTGTAFGLPLSGGGTSTTITPAPISMMVSLVSPVVRVGNTIAAPALSQQIAPVAPTVRVGSTITPSPIAQQLTLVAPTARVGTTVAPSPTSLRLALVPPTIRVGSRITPAPLTLRLTPIVPVVSAGSLGATNVIAQPLSMLLSPVPPTVRIGNRVTPTPLAQRLTAVPPTVRVGSRVSATSLLLRLSFGNISITGSTTPTPRIHPPLKARYAQHQLVADARNNNLRAEYPRGEQ
jgi:hypothetical protein